MTNLYDVAALIARSPTREAMAALSGEHGPENARLALYLAISGLPGWTAGNGASLVRARSHREPSSYRELLSLVSSSAPTSPLIRFDPARNADVVMRPYIYDPYGINGVHELRHRQFFLVISQELTRRTTFGGTDMETISQFPWQIIDRGSLILPREAAIELPDSPFITFDETGRAIIEHPGYNPLQSEFYKQAYRVASAQAAEAAGNAIALPWRVRGDAIVLTAQRSSETLDLLRGIRSDYYDTEYTGKTVTVTLRPHTNGEPDTLYAFCSSPTSLDPTIYDAVSQKHDLGEEPPSLPAFPLAPRGRGPSKAAAFSR